jgi:hypothetical protein
MHVKLCVINEEQISRAEREKFHHLDLFLQRKCPKMYQN